MHRVLWAHVPAAPQCNIVPCQPSRSSQHDLEVSQKRQDEGGGRALNTGDGVPPRPHTFRMWPVIHLSIYI